MNCICLNARKQTKLKYIAHHVLDIEKRVVHSDNLNPLVLERGSHNKPSDTSKAARTRHLSHS